MRIVQLANFYGPRSGGLRTALAHLGAGYTAHGHQVILIVPGASRRNELLDTSIEQITLPAPRIPGTGGYRLIDPWRVERLLRQQVSDRLTLRGLGRWADRRGIRSVAISHERLDRLLEQAGLSVPVARRIADLANARMAAHFDAVVCTTRFAQAEFDRIQASNVLRVPLGVDLQVFTPTRRDDGLRARLARDGGSLLVHCGRLSAEKHVERSVDTLAGLHETGTRVRLVIAGDGPRRAALQRRAAGLPVTFLGFLHRRGDIARLLASADVCIAPGPHETFGLAALEALACGTPVVASMSSALAELIRPDCGATVADTAPAFTFATRALLATDRTALRLAARARAEEFSWSASVQRMLAALDAP